MTGMALERHPEPGDYYANLWASFTQYEVKIITPQQIGWIALPDLLEAGGSIWLPRLDQWYAMIRATWARGGGPSIHLYGDDEAGYGCETDDRSVTVRGEGETPEEAAGRLWMAVTGRE